MNRPRARQLVAFDDLTWGKCRPTDIDFSVDFQQRVFIFGELKGVAAPLTTGQRIHLEGLVKAIRAGGREAYAFLAHHDTPDTNDDVHTAAAIVDRVYNGERWTAPDAMETVRDFTNRVYMAHTGEGES